MDRTSARPVASSIPRLSRLPVPRASGSSTSPSKAEDAPSSRLQSKPTNVIAKPKSNAASNDAVFKRPFPKLPSLPPSRQLEYDMPTPQLDDIQDVKTAPRVETETQTSSPSPARRSRPSLSERTIETLSQIPPSPSPRRRRTSNFFSNESPMRPSSAMDARSRPGSSLDDRGDAGRRDFSTGSPTKRLPAGRTSMTPNTRSIGPGYSNIDPERSPSRPALGTGQTRPSMGASLEAGEGSVIKPDRKSLSMRPSKSRPVAGGLGSKAPSRAETRSNANGRTAGHSTPSKQTPIKPRAPKVPAAVSKPPTTNAKAPKSSSALRESIAKAKAAARPQISKQCTASETTANDFDFDFPADSQETPARGNSKGLLRKRVDAARSDGRLNIAGMGLQRIPDEVLKMYDSESLDTSGAAWYESVDLIRFNAADNEIEDIGPNVFPDIDAEQALDDDDDKGNQFGGLETLDLHGNLLLVLPLGLRRLERLTILNLSNNKLSNDCLDVVTACVSLRELRLAGNSFEGSIPESVGSLVGLEILDLHGNSITGLPDSLCALVQLRVLNLADNRMSSLPFDAMSGAVTELVASKNQLRGILVPAGVKSLSSLQILDVSNNALSALSEATTLSLPAIQQLTITANRISSLPDVHGWSELIVLFAEDNNISDLPGGFTSLTKLKKADFTGNNLKKVDEHIGQMDNLEVLKLNSNPLRERRFLGMATEDLKQELLNRLSPQVDEGQVVREEEEDDDEAMSENAIKLPTWPIRSGSILDCSTSKLHGLSALELENSGSKHIIRGIDLHHNLLTSIPPSISLRADSLSSLNLSHNQLASSSFLTASLDLPHLHTLNLGANSLSTLAPLLTHLSSPALNSLDISCNRLVEIPALKATFPSLSCLLAGDNAIADLPLEVAQGLRVLDVQNNDLGSLEPRLGLLTELETLEVRGNRFRVPNWRVLEKGTAALKEWLRGRVPTEDEA